MDDVMTEWHDFVSAQREKELAQIIQEEKLREPETVHFFVDIYNLEGAEQEPKRSKLLLKS